MTTLDHRLRRAMAMLNQEVLVKPTELKERGIVLQAALALAAEGFNQVSAGELAARTKELGSHVSDWRIGQLGPTLGMTKGHTKAGNKLTIFVSSLQLAKRELEQEVAAIQPRIDDAVASLQPLIGEIAQLEDRVLLHKSLSHRLQAARDYLSAHDTSHKGLWMEFGPMGSSGGVKEHEDAVRKLQANKRRLAQLEKELEERPAVMAALDDATAKLAVSDQEREALEKLKNQLGADREALGKEKGAVDKEEQAIIARLASLQQVRQRAIIVDNNWDRLEADYEAAQSEYDAVWSIAQQIRLERETERLRAEAEATRIREKKARGPWWARRRKGH